MKILYIYESITEVNEGVGYLTHNRNTQEALKNLGHDVIVIDDTKKENDGTLNSLRKYYRKAQAILPKSLSIIIRDLYDIWRDRYIFQKKLEYIARDARPHFIYERLTPMHLAGIRTAKANSIPIITEIHYPWEEKNIYFSTEGFPWYSKKVYKHIIKNSDAIIVVSSALKEYIYKCGGEKDKIHIIPNAVNLDIFAKVNKVEVEKLRRQYHLSDKKIIGFIGSMAPYHGIDLLVEAAQIVIREKPEVVFLMIGPLKNNFLEPILAKINSLNLKNIFLFTGAVSHRDIPIWIELMDLCVMPDSNWYGSPIKLFEYGAIGKAVIMPKLTPIEDIITDSVNGLLFQPKNIEDLSRKILYALREEGKAKEMGKKLQDKILNQHTWIKNAERIINIAEKLIQTKIIS